MMNIRWIISRDVDQTKLDAKFLSNIAPSWGSYKTWRDYNTDNCVCNELDVAKDLIAREFNKSCNLWLPESFFVELGRPQGVNLFGGKFTDHDYPFKDDIVSLNLASENPTDIMLMLGFDLNPIDEKLSEYPKIYKTNYYKTILKHINDHPETQFVLINNTDTLSDIFKDTQNLLQDTSESVQEFL